MTGRAAFVSPTVYSLLSTDYFPHFIVISAA